METISVQDYAKQWIPFGAWVVVQKLPQPAKVGLIHLTDKTVEHNTKQSMLATVIAKSPFSVFENPQEDYIMGKIQLGDVIGFSATVPVYSPAPPGIKFEGGLNSEGLDIATLHVGDILGIFCADQSKIQEIKGRF